MREIVRCWPEIVVKSRPGKERGGRVVLARADLVGGEGKQDVVVATVRGWFSLFFCGG